MLLLISRGERWLFGLGGIALVLVFGMGAWIRFSMPSAPFMDPDTWDYLYPAVIQKITGNYFPTFREFVYPAFLIGVFHFFPSLEAVTKVQHLLGLFTAALLMVVFLRCRRFLPQGKLLDWSAYALALIAAYVFLFSSSAISLEHSIRPEAIFPLVCALCVLAGIEFSYRVLLAQRFDGLTLLWGALLAVFALGNYYLKPAWGVAGAAALLPFLGAMFLVPGRWLWKWGLPLGTVTLAALLFILPQSLIDTKLSLRKNRSWFLPATLLCAHAEILKDILAQDAASLSPHSKKGQVLAQFVQDIEQAQIHPSRKRFGLALNPDDLLYRGPVGHLREHFFCDAAEFNRLCYVTYLRGWLIRPLSMAAKVWRQMEFFYFPKYQNVYQKKFRIRLQEQYQHSCQSLKGSSYPHWEPLQRYSTVIESLQQKEDDSKFLSKKPSTLAWVLNNTFLIVFLLVGLVAVGVLCGGNIRKPLQLGALCALYLSTFNFAMSLTISTVHMMDVGRYHFNQISLSLLSQLYGFLFLIAVAQAGIAFCKKKIPYFKANSA